jgi:hypothetical protein
MKVKFIHVGCHKCGSTFIQDEVLPKLKNICGLTFSNDNPLAVDFTALVQCADLYYDAQGVQQSIHSKLESYGDICISSEALSGTNTAILGTGLQIEHIARRLRQVFGETKIWIVIRNQRTCMESLYKDDVKYGYLFNYKQWIKWRLNTYGLNYFKYSYLIRCYQNYFGIDNVMVTLFEELFNKQIITNILLESGVDVNGAENIDWNKRYNETYSPISLLMAKWINRLFGSKLTYGITFGKDPSIYVYNLFRYNYSIKLDKLSKFLGIKAPEYNFQGYQELLESLFQEDNRQVSRMIGKDLQQYGYL